jgi:hypothetical protein
VLDNLRTLITDPSSGALVHHRNRRSAHHSSHTPSEGHRKHPKSSTRKKYDWRRDPPPYMWTTDPTRETVRLWSTDGPNPFSFVVYKFDTRERIENYKREMWIMKNRPEDTWVYLFIFSYRKQKFHLIKMGITKPWSVSNNNEQISFRCWTCLPKFQQNLTNRSRVLNYGETDNNANLMQTLWV